jgi:hypothetical protein
MSWLTKQTVYCLGEAHFDHDEGTIIMLAGQAKLPDNPFDFTDVSVKEHLTGDWKEKYDAEEFYRLLTVKTEGVIVD